MNARKLVLIALLLVLAIAAVACASAPAPTPIPTAAQPTATPKATEAPVATEAPKPTTAPAAFDVKPVLDKYITNLPDGFSTIASAALKDQMATAKPFILDVREASEIAQNGFIEGSVNIPIRSLTKNLDKLPAKDQPIVTLCANGHRGAMAMETLQMLGYTNVKSLANGFNAWKAANLPVATGTPAAPVAGKAPEVDTDLFAALDKYLTNLPNGFGTIAPAGLKDQLAIAKPFLLDTREAKELTDNGFIEGAVNVPIRTLTKNLDKLPAKDQPIVVYCASGHRGAMVIQTLQLLGYTNVKSIAGGFNAWKAANFQVAK